MKSNRTFYTVIGLLLVACVIMLFLVYNNATTIANFISPSPDDKEQTEMCEDTSFQEPSPTIQEILEFRKITKEGMRIDSVFLTMPDIILIDILMTHGTDLSNGDIVKIYESNKYAYNKVISGANAQHYLDSLNKIPIDTVIHLQLK